MKLNFHQVWVLLIFTIAVIVPCMSILMRYFDFWNEDHQTRTMSQHLSNNAFFVLAIITNQGKDLTTTRSSLRFVAGIWCLATIVLASAYTGVMTSSMAVRKLKPIIKSLEELAASNEVTVTVDSNSVLANDMLVMRNSNFMTRETYLVVDSRLPQAPKRSWAILCAQTRIY